MDVFSPAACAVINLVEGIVNKILELLEGLISSILGPLQSILGILASPLNMIGGAIGKVMSFLGISCSGPSSSCPKSTVVCTDCSKDDEDDWLDNLLDNLADGDTGERFYCEESADYLDPKPTRIIFVGGIPNEPIPIPNQDPVPPGPGREDTPPFNPDLVPINDDDDDGPELPDEDDDDFPNIFPDDDDDGDDDVVLPITFDGSRVYSVIVDPTIVAGGGTVTYTINTSNVPSGSVLTYALTGDIVEEYINATNPSLIGTLKVTEFETLTQEFLDENGDLQTIDIPRCSATVSLPMNEDIELNDSQTFRFTLFDPGNSSLSDDNFDTGSFADVDIAADYESTIFPDRPENAVEDPTISVTSDKLAYIEGEDIIFTVSTSLWILSILSILRVMCYCFGLTTSNSFKISRSVATSNWVIIVDDSSTSSVPNRPHDDRSLLIIVKEETNDPVTCSQLCCSASHTTITEWRGHRHNYVCPW